MANVITNLVQPIGLTKIITVSTASTSSTLTSTNPNAIVGSVLVSNLTASNPVYVSVTNSLTAAVTPTTTGQPLVPVLSGTQVAVSAVGATLTSTVFLNVIAAGSGSIAITPLA